MTLWPRILPRPGRAALILALSGCTSGAWTDFPATPVAQAQLDAPTVEIVLLDAANVARFGAPGDDPPSNPPPHMQGGAYRVGTGDILAFTVWDHPELTSQQPVEGAPAPGVAVKPDGSFFFPYVGRVEARGRTPEEITRELTTRLGAYIPNPQIDLRIVHYASQKVLVLGEIDRPGAVTLTDAPLTLVEAVDRRGGFAEEADLARLTLERAGRTYALDFRAYQERGSARTNPELRDGDVIRVPRRAPRKAYLLGQVQRPGIVDLAEEDISLTEALTATGGLAETRANARGVFVFRGAGERILVTQLDLRSPVAFVLGSRFILASEDVVYVTTAPLARWNTLISQLLPTVTAAGAVSELQ